MTLLLLLLGCPETVSKNDTADYFPGDEDGDGWTAEEGDCDDNDRTLSPGQPEVWYDGIDQNCDGNDDDQDGDGSAVAKDCNDTDATVHPGADELCDELDNDCDEKIDEGAPDGTVVYADGDGDGYASDRADEVTICTSTIPSGFTELLGDCNDNNRDIAPGRPELCDGKDNDCDDEFDEDAIDADVWYRDADGDTYGLDGYFVRACAEVEGYVSNHRDCNDTDPDIRPKADEVCDGVDNDCNDLVDDDPIDGVTVYADADGDTFGDATTAETGCVGEGYTLDSTDCDDDDADAFPGNPESCDSVDNDCDGTVDEDVVTRDYYADADGDGYGAGAVAMSDCVASPGYAANADDCDDTSADVSPAGHELCNDIDDDCDGEVDSDATDASEFYLDEDADGYGLAGDSMVLCEADGDYSAVMTGDCDDGDDTVYPGAAESDNGDDDDCDDLVDEDFVAAGDLVIIEIARQPWMGGTSTDTDAQWFEVYNASGDTLRLSGWTVTRTSSVGTDEYSVDPDRTVTIPAGDVAVFCATDLYIASVDSDSILTCDYTWGDPSLADTYTDAYVDNTFHLQRDEDSLSLSVGGVVIDTVSWDASWPQEATRSMAVAGTPDATTNDSAATWELDTSNLWWSDGTSDEYGTPGSLAP